MRARWVGAALVASAVAAIGLAWWVLPRNGSVVQRFPDVDVAALSADQGRVVTVLRREFAAKPAGTKYSEGVQEPWCADFVSWVLREAGMPLSNPNSGSWRVPGVYTMRETFHAAGRYVTIGGDYQPNVGDVVHYDNSRVFGQHVNFVLANDHGHITTIGGNELGKIRIISFDLASAKGVLGFGRLR